MGFGSRIIKNFRGVAFGAAVLGFAGVSAWAEGCAVDQVDLRGDWGQARFFVEIADTGPERSRGLMHRESMASSAGMLFLYEKPQPTSFWMKNTLIPLDMLFIDETGVVTRIHENAIPLDTTSIDGGLDVIAVLEINGGMSEILGITEGSDLRHPFFEKNIAVWPCETP